MNAETVKVGQVWADNDKREKGRTIRVDETDDRWAYCTVLTPKSSNPKGRIGHRTRISLDRFRPVSTGYALVSDTVESR